MITIDKQSQLNLEDLVQVAREYQKVEISKDSLDAIDHSHEQIQLILEKSKPVYGINTGYGIFADKTIPENQIRLLNRNLIISHAVASGEPLDSDIVRAAILVRANTLAKGFSGVSKELILGLVEMLNKRVTPIIPRQGSLGSSGDLCLLSHLALVLTRDDDDREEESGLADFNGAILSGKKAMELAKIDRIILGPKEGLALNNGATFSAAIGALTVADAEYLLRVAEISAALSMEALRACSAAFDDRIHQLRLHHGQITTARNIRSLLEGSNLIDSSGKVQDAYSLRCAPQVQGAIRDSIHYVHQVIEKEINAVTDNPLIFEPGIALSGGNFHGEPVGIVMDLLGIALCELGAISERRTFRLSDECLSNGLPPMLVDQNQNAGLNSGLMIPQYTAASLVLENQTLATPDSIRSLPTSANQEDHNANATTAARHAREIAENVRQILAIELYTAAHAIDLRMKNTQVKLGTGTGLAYQKIREVVPYHSRDALWGPEIQKINQMIKDRIF